MCHLCTYPYAYIFIYLGLESGGEYISAHIQTQAYILETDIHTEMHTDSHEYMIKLYSAVNIYISFQAFPESC